MYILRPMDDIKNYEAVSKNGTAITKALMDIWERIGQPEDFYCDTGKALLGEIANVFTYFYRQEYINFLHDRNLDLKYEKPLHQLGKENHGITPISYPPTLFKLIRAMFPGAQLGTKKTQRVMFEVIPWLKTTNTKV